MEYVPALHNNIFPPIFTRVPVPGDKHFGNIPYMQPRSAHVSTRLTSPTNSGGPGLIYRDVEKASYEIAVKRGRPDFILHISRLADIENRGVVPRLHKLYSL
jgi:hypothetical protein